MKHCVAISCALLCASCTKATPEPESRPPAQPATVAATQPAPEVAEREARAVIEAWIAAQNAGDFSAYQAVYAATFTGIRRSGQRTVPLDRAAWMKDRRRMFERSMTVQIDDLEISPSPDGASLRFGQTWSSGSYTDTGVKAMTLVRDGGALRIVREEMLSSLELAPGQAAAQASLPAPAGVAAPPATAWPRAQPPAIVTGSFRGEPAWLVLGEHFEDGEQASRRAVALRDKGIEATPIESDWFQNLKPDWIPLVHGAYATRDEARARVAELTARGIKVYAKHSGPLAVDDAGAPIRLIRIVGLVEGDEVERPAPVSVDFEPGDTIVTITTDAEGWYQHWAAAPAGAIELKVEYAGELTTPEGCWGWHHESVTEPVPPTALEVQVDGPSPWPDCCPY